MLSPVNDPIVAPSLVKPKRPLPQGAVDVHAHVFGPYDRFPLAPERLYTPPLAPYEAYIAMLDYVGFSHGVVVHAGAAGFDCRATLNALERSNSRLRGTAVAERSISDTELEKMNAGGIRALRFTEIGNTAAKRPPGMMNFEDLEYFAPRLRALGWHAVIWAKCEIIVTAAPKLLSYGIPIVIDHMGYFDASKGVNDPAFQSLLGLLGEGSIWVKTTPVRNSESYPAYPEVRPFFDALLRAPDRLLWGSDWPFLGLGKHQPEVGRLVDLFDEWTGDEVLRNKILVSNPAALYGF